VNVLKESCVIGLDLGTTSTKAVAFNAQNKVIAKTAKEVNTTHAGHGQAEQDPVDVAKAALHALTQTAYEAVRQGYEVSLVGFSAAMHSLIAIDEAGQPLTKAIIWMDGRAADEAMELRASDQCGRLYQRTGAPVHPMTPLLKLIWFRNHQPELLQRATRFVSQKEFIWAQWFGEWTIDESTAGATGLYGLASRTWDTEALALAGIQESQLSRIAPTMYCKRNPVHPSLKDCGLGDTVFNVGSSDGVLANLGVGATDNQAMVLTLGTSCALRMTTRQAYLDKEHMPFCYRLDDEHYVVGGPSNSGGVVVDWLANTILSGDREEEQFDRLLTEAEQVETESLICLPYVAGERAPLWNAHSTGALIGLQVHHGAAHVFRAGLEGILFNAFWIAESLMKEGYYPTQLVASGKLLESAFLRQMCADIFNLPVASCEDADASVLGAVALARIAVGETSYEVLRTKLDNPELTHPDAASHAAYAEKYSRFRTLVQSVLSSP
jgi:gluconokinase